MWVTFWPAKPGPEHRSIFVRNVVTQIQIFVVPTSFCRGETLTMLKQMSNNVETDVRMMNPHCCGYYTTLERALIVAGWHEARTGNWKNG